ncbi:FadR/GntR family transcriptional regulator [Oceanicella sp. SM1341]|uniref:FadR/GntR family transcriptional regulator n=1 Tax=Oceanicella sp. SM1341 TaxID=1548889 RepID=UPI000E4E4C15|nr:GntR family transcriptional regulator [Oceanicella sp. SM1341]
METRLGFKPVRTKRAFEEVCEQIRAEIRSGRLSAGDKLPAERELAEQLRVSRATIREAFRTLEIGGVLTLQKGVKGGAVVMRGDTRPITQTITDLLALGGLSLDDYTEARTCLQREVIQLACARGTEEDFAALEANIEQTRQMTNPEQIEDRTALTVEFYLLLSRATRNKAMEILMAAVTEPLAFYIKKIGVDRSWDVAASRTLVVRHLRERNAVAAIDEMVAHMDRLHAYMLSRKDITTGP